VELIGLKLLNLLWLLRSTVSLSEFGEGMEGGELFAGKLTIFYDFARKTLSESVGVQMDHQGSNCDFFDRSGAGKSRFGLGEGDVDAGNLRTAAEISDWISDCFAFYPQVCAMGR